MGTGNGGGCGGAGFRIRVWELFAPAPKNELRFGTGFARRIVAGHIATNAEPEIKRPCNRLARALKPDCGFIFFRAADAFRESDSIEVRRGFYGLKNTRLLKRAGGNTCGRRSSERAVFGNLTCNQEPAAANVQSGGGRHLVRHKKYARKLRGTIFTVSLKRLMAGYCTPYGLALNRLPDTCCAHTLCDEKEKGHNARESSFLHFLYGALQQRNICFATADRRRNGTLRETAITPAQREAEVIPSRRFICAKLKHTAPPITA